MTTESERSPFAKRLIKVRQEKGMSGPELAKKIGCKYGSYHHYEIKANPPFEILIKIIEALDVSVEYFFKPFISLADPEYTDFCEKIKIIKRNQTEWDTIKTVIERFYEKIIDTKHKEDPPEEGDADRLTMNE